jgi:hypothetical protein
LADDPSALLPHRSQAGMAMAEAKNGAFFVDTSPVFDFKAISWNSVRGKPVRSFKGS